MPLKLPFQGSNGIYQEKKGMVLPFVVGCLKKFKKQPGKLCVVATKDIKAQQVQSMLMTLEFQQW
jgi:hypothetical protein